MKSKEPVIIRTQKEINKLLDLVDNAITKEKLQYYIVHPDRIYDDPNMSSKQCTKLYNELSYGKM